MFAWWIALILLGSALVPTVSRWWHVSTQSTGPLAEICSATGTRTIVLSDSQNDQPGSALVHALDHCGLCLVQAHAPALGFSLNPVRLAQGAEHLVAERFLSAPDSAHVWAASLARAPPLLAALI
jgi:hypothetical protein